MSLSSLFFRFGMLGPTFRVKADDIVVFVVGPSGSGKSWFIKEVTQSDLVGPSESLVPSTRRVQAIRCELSSQVCNELQRPSRTNIVFVDTPSFLTGRDYGAEREMNNWLRRSGCRSSLIGVIYMHRIETHPADERIQKHLDAFADTFPLDFVNSPQRLHAVLSCSGRISEERIEARRAAFQEQLEALHPSRSRGGRVRWVPSIHPNLFERKNPETAWRAVVDLFTQ